MLGVGGGVAEHVEEDGPREFVEADEGLPAQAPQGVGPIEDVGDPPLLLQRREGDDEFFKNSFS